jgi:hypothetical protein
MRWMLGLLRAASLSGRPGWRGFRRLLRNSRVAMAVTMALAGCAASPPPGPEFVSRADVRSALPLGRLLVVSTLVDTRLDEAFFQGFQDTLKSRLAPCGGELKLMRTAPKASELDQQVLAAVAQSRPDAVLLLGAPAAGTPGAAEERWATVELRIIDQRERRQTWQARLRWQLAVGTGFADRVATGQQVARMVMRRLDNDGLPLACAEVPPAKDAGAPGQGARGEKPFEGASGQGAK